MLLICFEESPGMLKKENLVRDRPGTRVMTMLSGAKCSEMKSGW